MSQTNPSLNEFYELTEEIKKIFKEIETTYKVNIDRLSLLSAS